MRLTLFKMPRHRVFHHKPIYYDEAKEEQAERLKNAKEELGLLSEDEKLASVGSRIRGGMKKRRADFFEQAYSEKRKSAFRLVVIILALMGLAYWLMGEYKDAFFEVFFSK